MKLSPQQIDVIERMVRGADLIVPDDNTSPVVVWTIEDGNRNVRWNVFQALLRRGCIESYKLSSLGRHYMVVQRGRVAYASQFPAPAGSAVPHA